MKLRELEQKAIEEIKEDEDKKAVEYIKELKTDLESAKRTVKRLENRYNDMLEKDVEDLELDDYEY